MQHRLPALPYPKDALAPHLSAESFDYHYGKHHAAYVAKLNELLAGHAKANLSLEDLILSTTNVPGERAIFNNAAQHWNHSLFWKCMSPTEGGAPAKALEQKLSEAFGSVDEFKKSFVAAGVSQFGSGWVWLVQDGPRLEILTTSNADNPLIQRKTALLVCDVWEHAYYIDHRNGRQAFLQVFVDRLVNWEEAARRMSG